MEGEVMREILGTADEGDLFLVAYSRFVQKSWRDRGRGSKGGGVVEA